MFKIFNIFKKKESSVVVPESINNVSEHIGLEEAIKNMNKDSKAIPSVNPVVKEKYTVDDENNVQDKSSIN